MADMEASVTQLVREFTKVRGLVKEQLHSYNHFLTTEIRNTVRMNNEIRSRVDPDIYLRFKDVKVGEPSIMIDGIRRKLFPQSCRLTGMTHAAAIEACIQYVCKCNGEKKIFERVILIQERFSDNRVFIDIDNKGNFIASVTSNTGTWRSKTLMVMENGKIYAQLSQLQEKEIAGHGVHTKKQALQFLEEKVRKPQHPCAPQGMENRAFMILHDEFIAHVPVHNNNFHQKCMYTAFMVRRMLNALVMGKGDGKDYIGNKKFELSGWLLSFLFKALFNMMIAKVIKQVDAILSKPTKSELFDFSKYIVTDTISFGLERALSAGNWSVKGFMVDRKGVTQVLGRMSFIQAMGALTSIQSGFVKSRRAIGHRALQASHV